MSRRTKDIYSSFDAITGNNQNGVLGDSQALGLGYASNLNKDTAQQVFQSADFLQDAADYYYNRDGKTFSSAKEIQEYFMSDRRWKNMNTISIGKDLYNTNTQGDQQNARLARMQTVFDALPDFYEDGGDGWKGFGENAAAALLDPINLIGFGAGGKAASLAASRAIASGATKQQARNAGLKAGVKRGAYAEGAVSGVVEGIHDGGIQARNIGLGIQDEYSLTQGATAVAAGTALGGTLGGFFGAAGAINPLRPGRKSKIAEGMLAGANSRRAAATQLRGERQAAAAAEATPAPARFSTEESDAVAEQLDIRLARVEEQRAEAETDTPDTVNDLDSTTPVEQNEVAVGKAATAALRNLRRAADANTQKAQESAAKGDADNAAKFSATANAQTQKANSIQVAVERILNPEEATTDDDILLLSDATKGADEMLQLTFDATAPRTQPTADPNGGVFVGDKPAEVSTPANTVQPEPNAQPIRGNAPDVEPEDVVVEAAVDERIAETKLNEATAQLKPAKAKVEELQARLAKEEAEGATPEVVEQTKSELGEATTQLQSAETNMKAAKEGLDAAQSKRREVMQTRMAAPEEVADVEGTPEGNPVDAPEGVEIVDDVNDFTPDNIAATTPTNTTAIVSLLEQLGEDPKKIRKDLSSLGDGRKADVKVKRREFLRAKLMDVYTRTKMLNIIDLVNTTNERAMFHVPAVRELLAEQAETPEIAELMIAKYNQFIAERSARLFVVHLEETGADPVRAATIIGDRYGPELVELMNQRLDKGGAASSYGDPERLRNLFKSLPKERQAKIRQMEEAVIADMMRKDPEFVEGKVREIVADMTELHLEREARKRGITTRRSDTQINTEMTRLSSAVQELRQLRQTIVGLKATVAPVKKATMTKAEDFPLTMEQLDFIVSGKGDIVRYETTGSAPRTEKQQELVDAIEKARALSENLGFKGISIGETIERLNDRMSGLENMRGQDIVIYAQNQMRSTNDFSVADEFANNALHIGAQRRQGLGKYTVYGKEVQGGDAIRRAQGMLSKANKHNIAGKLREFGVKVDADGRLERVGSNMHALEQQIEATIAAANNRMVRDDIKIERNAADIDPLKAALKAIDKQQNAIKRLQKKIDASEADDVAELEAKVDEANTALATANAEAEKLLDVSMLNNAESPRQALQLRIKELSQSTGKEAAGNLGEQKRANAAVLLLRGELVQVKRRLANIMRRKTKEDGSKMSEAEEVQLREQMQRISAELDKAVISDKRLERVLNKPMKDNIRAERAAEDLLKGEEMPKEDFAGDITPEIAEQANDIANEVQRHASAEARFAQRFLDLAEANLDAETRLAEMQKLNAELQAHKDATQAPAVQPAGKKHKPRVVVVDGIEVDANNDISYSRNGDRVEVGFEGEKVGFIQEISPTQIMFVRTGGDALNGADAKMFNSKSVLRDRIPFLIKDVITRVQNTTEKFDVRPDEEGRSYVEPDWRQTETYREEPPVPETATPDPIVEPKPKSDPNNELTWSADDFDVPPMRDIAVQIIDPAAGKMYGQVRVFNLRKKQTLGDVLKNSAKYKYVVGSVESGRKGKSFGAQETFRPLDGDAEFVPHYQEDLVKAADVDPVQATSSPKVRKNRPVQFNKLESIAVDQETLSFTPPKPIKNAAELLNYADSLDFIPWNKLKTTQEYLDFMELRARVATDMKRIAPNGVKRPTQKMRESMSQLTGIMDNLAPGETQAAVDFMMRLARVNAGEAPIFTEGYGNNPMYYAQGKNLSNKIVLVGEKYSGRFDQQQIPMTFKVAHELGHWVYMNMLDDADRLEFWGSMRKYYDEEGFVAEDFQRRADLFGDGGQRNNALHSPAEFFANQFVMWAAKSDMVPNLTLWEKIARMGAKLMDMITGNNALELDPDLVPIFQRAIPPLGIDPVTGVSNNGVSAFAHLAEAGKRVGKDGGNAAYIFGKGMADLDVLRHDIATAVATSSYAVTDATALAETLKTAGRRVYGMVGGERHATHHKDYGRSKTVIDADGTSRHVEQGNRGYDYMKTLKSYDKLMKAQYAIHDYLNTLSEEGAMLETKDGILGSLDLNDGNISKIEAMIDRQFSDMENMGSFDAQSYALAAMQSGNRYKGIETKAVMHLHRLAQEMMLAMDDAIAESARKYTMQIPRSGREFVTIDLREGIHKGRMYQSQNKKSRKHQDLAATAEAQRQEDYWNLKGFVQAVNAERRQKFENYADPIVSDSTKQLDSDALAREGADLPRESKRSVDIANELKDRQNAQAKSRAEELTDAERIVIDSIVDEQSARKVLDHALGMQNNPEMAEMAGRLINEASAKLNQMGVENPLPVTNPKVSEAIDTTVKAKAGTDDDIGIDADSPAAIKTYARLLTNRDQRSQYVGRQVFQRMMTLLGYEEPNQYSANIILGRDPIEFGDNDEALIPTDGEDFIGVIKRMRRIAKMAQDPNDSTTATALVSESVYQMLSNAEKRAVAEFAELNDEAPQQFFAGAITHYLHGKRKGRLNFDTELNKAGWIKDANAFQKLIDREAQSVAFILNGLEDTVGAPMMAAYGDMFAGARAMSPHVNAADAVNRNAVSPAVAGRYAAELIGTMTGRLEQAARDFIGIPPQRPLRDYVMFNKSDNPGDVTTRSGEYGDGIYVTTGQKIDRDYSPDTFLGDMDAEFNSAGLSGNNLVAAQEASKMIVGLRERIKRASNEGKPKAHIRDLLHMEDLQWRIINAVAPQITDNKVAPVFIRSSNAFDFTSNNKYTLNQASSNNIGHIIADMASAGLLRQEGVQMLFDNLPDGFTGRELFTALTHERIGAMHLGGNSANPEVAKNNLNAFLTDYGYDAIDTDDGKVIFNASNVRHVKHGFTESETTGYRAEQRGGDMKIGGDIVAEMIYRNEVLPKGHAPAVAADMNRGGTPQQISDLAVKMLKGQDLKAEDIECAGIFSTVRNAFTENSNLFRRQGATWFGDSIKPMNGAGLFEEHDVQLNKIIGPIFAELNKLPGSDKSYKRWARKNVEFINQIGQPPAHKRIIRALREGRDAVERLNPEERNAALKIAAAFEKELNSLKDMGIPVGDARRYGNDFYIPQLWDSEAVLANPNKFKKGLFDYLVRESRKPDSDFNGSVKDIEALADVMFNNITREGGVIDGSVELRHVMSDPFAKRVLRLQKEDMPQLHEFLVEDLSGLLARYFDRTVRKRVLTKRFGVQGHGLDTYRAIIASPANIETAVKILQSDQHVVKQGQSLAGAFQVPNRVAPKLDMTSDEVMDILRKVKIATDKGDKHTARNILLNAYDDGAREMPQLRVRVDAVVNAIHDFPSGNASGNLMTQMEEFNNLLNKRPLDGSDGSAFKYKFSRTLKAFNSVSLLGFTTLTSLPDLALPLVRSGNFAAWAKAHAKWHSDPNYKAMSRNIGVGIENLMHDRMVQMAGDGSQKFTNAFFNFTLLTPWTNMQREIAAMVGFESFKTEINRAVSMRMNGKQDTPAYRTAVRYLERYGLTGENAEYDFLAPGATRIDEPPVGDTKVDDQLRAAMMRFTNEAIFTPNPNDVPMWAQTPIGGLIFQLKSFPLMMSRLSVDVGKEAAKGNLKPFIYMMTAGVGLGSASLGVKDLVQSRGGEDQKSVAFRERSAAKNFGIPLLEEGGDWDERAGWYLEGLMAMGGLGLFAELLYNSAAQLDNGKYGFVRTMSYVFGPSFGVAEGVFDVGAGVKDAVVGDAEKNSKERQAARQIATRVPILGGVRSFRESAADLFGEGGRKSGKSKGFGSTNFGNSNFGKGKFGE